MATDLPLVVVVDGNTASSAEIVSGALQDAARAKVVGETTFGTGTVLGEFDLSDGSALRVGTVEWLTPSGRRIWHEGIAPDVPIALPDGVVPLSPDDVAKLTAATVGSIDDAAREGPRGGRDPGRHDSLTLFRPSSVQSVGVARQYHRLSWRAWNCFLVAQPSSGVSTHQEVPRWRPSTRSRRASP